MVTADLLDADELKTALGAMREGLQIVDREWRYVFLNDAAAAHGRRSREELLGRTMMECYPGIERADMFQVLDRCMRTGGSAELENVFSYPDGATRTFELRVEGCGVGVMVLSVDVTDRRKVEEQLRHAQKMEAIGRLAGSVAHDFNNLLSVILTYADLILEGLRPLDPMRADLETIRAVGNKATVLTKQLLAFSRQQVLTPRILDLNEVLAGLDGMLRRLIGEDIELVTTYGSNLGRVKVDPGQIDQVVMNLAVNARDAMPSGGKLTIETSNVVLDQAYASMHVDVTSGAYVMLAISDTGIGMDKETQLRAFEPFFTTKDQGKGTGLGLATVFGIIKQSGGSIWVYSEPGNGSTFKIYLPVCGDEDHVAPESAAPSTLKGSETILLVEDQEEVRRAALQILRRYGYHVLEARSAGDALLICEKHPRQIHLLLTDVIMPKIGGSELAERLRVRRPGLRVLYMSGYTEHTIVNHGILDSGINYLQKPFVPETLARRVREVLEAPIV